VGELHGALDRALANKGYTLRNAHFGKAFPLGIQAVESELASAQGPLLKLDKVRLTLRIFPLFLGRVVIDYRGSIGAGSIEGDCTLTGNSAGTLDIRGVRLEDIPFFATVAGAQAKGELRASGSFRQQRNVPTGALQLAVRGAELRGLKISGAPLPDATYKTVQGMLRLADGRANLESFTLDGEGLYVRLKGDMPLVQPVTNAPLNLTLEMMPKPDFLEKQKFVFLLMLKYLTSPGHYQIPIRGTLAKPALS
jgi:type II secretion system protein N